MVRSLYLSIVLALALIAGQSDAAATSTSAMARRQQYGVAQDYSGSQASSSTTSFRSESHYERVSTSFHGLLDRIQTCQSSVQQSSFTEQTATQEIQQVAARFEYAFNQLQACDSCMHRNQIGNFQQTFTKLFSSFHSLVQSYEQRFPEKWHLLFQRSFSGLEQHFGQFFGNCQNAGLPITTFVPQQMGSFFSKTSMTSTATFMQRSGFSF